MQLLETTETLETKYPETVEFANQQLKIFWLPDEIKVEKDIQDVLVNFTEAEKHGVITTLKLFSLYELRVGTGYWNGWFMDTFQRPDLQRMAAAFGMVELCIHKPFYTKLNELLHLDNDNFYLSYHDNEVLAARMQSIENILDAHWTPLTLAAMSIIEGAVLYSSFAFLKHFQSVGKNKLMNVVRGINFSVRDENIHSQAGAWMFKQFLKEAQWADVALDHLKKSVEHIAYEVYHHECDIIDMIFEKGSIEGITATQMKHFVESRINICLNQLGYDKMFEVDYNPVAKWFYEGINGFTFNDQFSGVGAQYHRNWDETAFKYEEYNDTI